MSSATFLTTAIIHVSHVMSLNCKISNCHLTAEKNIVFSFNQQHHCYLHKV